MVTIVGHFTKALWTFLIKLKFEVFQVIRNFLNKVKTQFEKSVKIVRTDNRGEFVNEKCKEIFHERGIIHQKTCTYTPQ